MSNRGKGKDPITWKDVYPDEIMEIREQSVNEMQGNSQSNHKSTWRENHRMSLDVGTLNAYLKLDSTQFTAALLTAQAKTQEFSASIVASWQSRRRSDQN